MTTPEIKLIRQNTDHLIEVWKHDDGGMLPFVLVNGDHRARRFSSEEGAIRAYDLLIKARERRL